MSDAHAPPPVILDMRLGLGVRQPDLVTGRVRSEIALHPYAICPGALPPLQQRVARSIARGVTREAHGRGEKAKACRDHRPA